MVKGTDLHVRITTELKKAAINDANKRGMKLSKYVETALIHELNRKTDDGTIHELQNLQNIISQRIEELQVQHSDEYDDYIDKDLDNALQDVDHLQKTFGYVTEGVVKRNAKIAGLTFEEFLQELKTHNIEIVILK